MEDDKMTGYQYPPTYGPGLNDYGRRKKTKQKDDYKCGHGHKPVFLDNNVLSFAAYEEWRTSKGFDGDNSMCFPCYCKEDKKRKKNFRDRNRWKFI